MSGSMNIVVVTRDWCEEFSAYQLIILNETGAGAWIPFIVMGPGWRVSNLKLLRYIVDV